MKTTLLITFLMTAALAACGGKANKSTTPDNKADTTDMNAGGGSATEGAATGGATYGGSAAPAPEAGSATDGAAADPCGGGM
jgi:hypothetical protein